MQTPSFDQTVSLALSFLSMGQGIFSIWLSLYFYRRSNEVNNLMMSTMSQLLVSARTTEATTTQVTTRALDVLAGHFEHRVEEAEHEGRVRVAESVAEALAGVPERERHDAQVAAARAVSEAFLKLKSSVAPTSHDYDWGPFIRRIEELQRNNGYLSVKWLHQKVFGDDPGMQEALQIAIEHQVLGTYQRTNPHRPRFPTLCCELNASHPAVVHALAPVLLTRRP